MALTLLAGLALFLVSIPAVATLLMVLTSRAIPYDDLGASFFLVVIGMLVLAPALWVGLIVWTFNLVSRHGDPHAQKRIPWVYAALGFLGATPVMYAAVCVFSMFSPSKSGVMDTLRNTFGIAEEIAVLGGLISAGGCLAVAMWARRRRKAVELRGWPLKNLNAPQGAFVKHFTS